MDWNFRLGERRLNHRILFKTSVKGAVFLGDLEEDTIKGLFGVRQYREVACLHWA